MNKTQARAFSALRHSLFVILFSLFAIPSHLPCLADEGMWQISRLHPQLIEVMQSMGLQLTADQIYSETGPSLKDAVVSFGGFCTGVVVSSDGLVFTNHHCGLSSVVQLSTLEHDYYTRGFVAQSYEEELPCPDLYVRFLVSATDVSSRVHAAISACTGDVDHDAVADSIADVLRSELCGDDESLTGSLDSYFGDSLYLFSVYRDYDDVRLVLVPPACIGKFGGDTDNWTWPRHTADFCVFRIYAGHDNAPAEYSPDNRPYRPAYVVPLSDEGYADRSFCLTIGYPGTTERRLSVMGLDIAMSENQFRADVYREKLSLWRQAMAADSVTNLMYADKYASLSNSYQVDAYTYPAVHDLRLISDRAREMKRLREEDAVTKAMYDSLFYAYKGSLSERWAFEVLLTTLFRGVELIDYGMNVLTYAIDDDDEDEQSRLQQERRLRDTFDHIDMALDREVFILMLKTCRENIDPDYLPVFFNTIDEEYNGDIEAYADYIYGGEWAQSFSIDIEDTPLADICLDVIIETISIIRENSFFDRTSNLEAQLSAHLYPLAPLHYPDADGTMRLSYGIVNGYFHADGAYYINQTTLNGIREKSMAYANRDNPDYNLTDEALDLLIGMINETDEGYDLPLCFLTTNDISGGNSGSPVLDARGRLLGLAFDGNREAMSSDYRYEPDLQRCIAVDVRFITRLIRQMGGERILDEIQSL